MHEDLSEDFGAKTPLGEFYSPDEQTLWRRVRVLMGSGYWAYWIREENSTYCVVADTIFNRHAPHFAGRLREAHLAGRPEDAWLIVHGWAEPAPEKRIYIEDEDAGLPRMERR